MIAFAYTPDCLYLLIPRAGVWVLTTLPAPLPPNSTHTHWRPKEIIAGLTCYNFTLFALLLFLRSQSPFQCNYVIRAEDYKQTEICALPPWALKSSLFPAEPLAACTPPTQGGRPETLRARRSPGLPALPPGLREQRETGKVSRLSSRLGSTFRRQSKLWGFFFPSN